MYCWVFHVFCPSIHTNLLKERECESVLDSFPRESGAFLVNSLWKGASRAKVKVRMVPQFEGNVEKYRAGKGYQGKILERHPCFDGNPSLCSPPRGKKTNAPDWSVTVKWVKWIHDTVIWRSDDKHCLWHSAASYLTPHVYCLSSFWMWKKKKSFKVGRFLFVFSARDQSQVALKLARNEGREGGGSLHCVSLAKKFFNVDPENQTIHFITPFHRWEPCQPPWN